MNVSLINFAKISLVKPRTADLLSILNPGRPKRLDLLGMSLLSGVLKRANSKSRENPLHEITVDIELLVAKVSFEKFFELFIIYPCNHALSWEIYCSQVIFHWFYQGS